MVLPTTRLNKKIRTDILNRLLMHRFGPELRAFARENAAIAQHIFDNTFTFRERELIDEVPKEWLNEEQRIEIQVSGQRHVLQFNGSVYWRDDGLRHFTYHFGKSLGDGYRRMPDRYDTWKVDAPSAIGRRVLDAEAKRGELEVQFKTVIAAAKATLGSYNTIGTLEKGWPEVKPFLPKTEEQVRVPEAPLPVVSNELMNAMLRLPIVEGVDADNVVDLAG
jgi:hypothetical protein